MKHPPYDERDPSYLGMDQSIHREDHLSTDSTSTVATKTADTIYGLTAEDWDGFSGVGDYRNANGNTHAVMMDGHSVRDESIDPFFRTPKDAEETYDCVVVGAGISGLAAAQVFKQQAPDKTCLILDNHPVFGGEARRNEFDVDGHRLIAPQGSAMFFPPLPGSSLFDFYQSMGFDGKELDYQALSSELEAMPVANTTYAGTGENLGMFFGAKFGHPEGLWVTDPYGKKLEGTPFPLEVKRQLLGQLQPPVAEMLPRAKTFGDEASRALDRISMEDLLIRNHGYTRDMIRTYMPDAASGAGSSADAISALADYVPDLLFPYDTKQGSQMFPGGNTGIARFQIKALIPDSIPGPATSANLFRSPINFNSLDRPDQPIRVRLKSTVYSVQHEGSLEHATAVSIAYLEGGKLHRIRARSVVMAGGWSTWRIVQDLPDSHRGAYQQFFRMPCLVANIALTNWRFLAKNGLSEAVWFEGLGNSFAVRRMPSFSVNGTRLSPDDPIVLTLKIYFTEPGLSLQEQATRGRMKMLSTPFSEYERTLREQFQLMFGRWGFDAKRDIAGIILNRWGHAYLCAQPGFFFGTDGTPAPREILRRAPFYRIAFANSDLSGIMDHRASIAEAQRAVTQLLA
jgi:spermidine dehydrogenase